MKNFRRKKYLSVFVLLLVFSSIVCANEIVLFVGKGHNYDKITAGFVDTSFKIILNTESGEYYFYTTDYSTSGWIIFSEDDFNKFRTNLLKYKKWENIAIDNEAVIEKALPDSEITGDVRWKSEERVYSGKNITVSFTFLSQSKDWHQLVITSSTTEATETGHFFRLEPIYLGIAQIDAMIDSISFGSIQGKVNEYRDLKQIETLFE